MSIILNLPIGTYVEEAVYAFRTYAKEGLNFISDNLKIIIDGFGNILNAPPAWVMILIISIIAFLVGRKHWGLAIGTAIGLWIIEAMGLWAFTMATLSLILSSTFLGLLFGIPIGILCAKSDKVFTIVKPLLDFMQTMPAFVYLIPAVIFFGLGVVPGLIATLIFAMPPAIRLTNLGIRQVPIELKELADSYGSTPMQKLTKVEFPLAFPNIMAGVNQTIMLSLSMVVISAMIGAGGLGQEVLRGITQLRIGLGFEAGLAVVIIAIILDRITQYLNPQEIAKRKKQEKNNSNPRIQNILSKLSEFFRKKNSGDEKK